MEWTYMQPMKGINNILVELNWIHRETGNKSQYRKSLIKNKGEKKVFIFFNLSDEYKMIECEILNEFFIEVGLMSKAKTNFLINVYDNLYIYDHITKENATLGKTYNLRTQLRINLCRATNLDSLPDDFTWLQNMQIHNFYLWKNHFIERGEDSIAENQYFFKENLETILKKSQQFQDEERDLISRLQQTQPMRNHIDEKLQEQEPRRIQSQNIRRIPGYDFFELYKHELRKCLFHQRINFWRSWRLARNDGESPELHLGFRKGILQHQ